jgi:predicted TIM-barrel fold metal-dependent hydrolase
MRRPCLHFVARTLADMYVPSSITDAHIHLWRLDTGWYPHLEGDKTAVHRDERAGDYSALVGRDYGLAEYFTDVGAWPVRKSVHITACQTPPSWSAETEWLQKLFENDKQPHAVIGWIDLRQSPSDLEREIDSHMAYRNFRGFRNQEGIDYTDTGVHKAFEIFERRDLIYDLVCHEDQLSAAASAADKFPSMQFVLEHTGWPRSGDRATFNTWRSGIADLARRPNVACKLSGLGMTFHRVDLEEMRPWITEIVSAFGAERSMFASNFPVDGLYSSYDALVRVNLEILSSGSANEIDLIFGQTADRTYRI